MKAIEGMNEAQRREAEAKQARIQDLLQVGVGWDVCGAKCGLDVRGVGQGAGGVR